MSLKPPQTNDFIQLTVPEEYLSHKGPLLTDDNEGVFVYSTTGFEPVPYLGVLRHVEGATHPAKGIPQPQAIYELNIIKTFTKEFIRYLPFFWFFVSKDKIFSSFNVIFDRAMTPYKVNRIYMCKSAYGLYRTIREFLHTTGVNEKIADETAYNIAHFMEYDDAWRYFIQDLATEANEYNLIIQPRKEIKRLISILRERATKTVAEKLARMVSPLIYLLVIPKYRHAFIQASQHIKCMQFDEADRYWVSFRDDYKFFGKTFEERSVGVQIPPLYRIG